MNDLDLLGSLDPAPVSLPAAGRHELLAELLASSPAPRRRRRRLALLGAGSAVLAITGGGLAYAVIAGQSPQTALKLNCAAGISQSEWDRFANFTNVLDTASGDPVADCADEYVRVVGAAPELRAYQTGSVYIQVMPSTWTVPAGWKPLPSTFHNDSSRLELKQRLDDLVDGPRSACRDIAAAEALVRRDLAELGLTSWTVERLPDASKADGGAWCAMAFLDEGGSTKVLMQGWQTPMDGGGELRSLATYLRRDVAGQCLTLPAAQRVTKTDLEKAGLKVAESKVTALVDATAKCTRVDLVPAGLTVVVLRGPQG